MESAESVTRTDAFRRRWPCWRWSGRPCHRGRWDGRGGCDPRGWVDYPARLASYPRLGGRLDAWRSSQPALGARGRPRPSTGPRRHAVPRRVAVRGVARAAGRPGREGPSVAPVSGGCVRRRHRPKSEPVSGVRRRPRPGSCGRRSAAPWRSSEPPRAAPTCSPYGADRPSGCRRRADREGPPVGSAASEATTSGRLASVDTRQVTDQ